MPTSIAQDTIILTSVDDAFAVSLTPDSCVIPAAFDGTSPKLESAFTIVSVHKGGVFMPISVTVTGQSHEDVRCKIEKDGDTKTKVSITSLPPSVLSGYVELDVKVEGHGFVIPVTFGFTVVRESEMLDWIIDWENNKTKLTDSYLITPKIFVGQKVSGDKTNGNWKEGVTGLYMGIVGYDAIGNPEAGMYGYKEGDVVFYINNKEAMIGGWTINQNSLSTTQSIDGSEHSVTINSDGSISHFQKSEDGTDVEIFMIKSDGSASFSQGKVIFGADGSASFEGIIKALEGEIGGWTLGKNAIYKDTVLINSAQKQIAILAQKPSDDKLEGIVDGGAEVSLADYGGVSMFYKDASNYGLKAYPTYDEKTKRYQLAFSLGSENIIAGWKFDNNKIWSGTEDENGNVKDGITISPNAISGPNWSLEIDNVKGGNFPEQSVRFEGGVIAGIQFLEHGFYGHNLKIMTQDDSAAREGLYFTSTFSGATYGNMELIREHGGFGLTTHDVKDDKGETIGSVSQWEIWSRPDRDKDGAIVKGSSYKMIGTDMVNKTGYIAGWDFDLAHLYSGDGSAVKYGEYGNADSISLAPDGLKGLHWRLEKDGSGGIAGDKLYWDKDGNLYFDRSISNLWESGSSSAMAASGGRQLLSDPGLRWSEDLGEYIAKHFSNAGISGGNMAPNSSRQHLVVSGSKWNEVDGEYVPQTAGFVFKDLYLRLNASFIIKFNAIVPKDWQVDLAGFGVGSLGSVQWLTSQMGTGNWQEYSVRIDCRGEKAGGKFGDIVIAWTGDANTETSTIKIKKPEQEAFSSLSYISWTVSYMSAVDLYDTNDNARFFNEDGEYTADLGGWRQLYNGLSSREGGMLLDSWNGEVKYSRTSSGKTVEGRFGGDYLLESTHSVDGNISKYLYADAGVLSIGNGEVQNGVVASITGSSHITTKRAAVFGRASNKGAFSNAYTFGGYFNTALIEGLNIGVKEGDVAQPYYMTTEDTFVMFRNVQLGKEPSVILPECPPVGKVLTICMLGRTSDCSIKIYGYLLGDVGIYLSGGVYKQATEIGSLGRVVGTFKKQIVRLVCVRFDPDTYSHDWIEI